MARVLITGGSGFVGTEIRKQLADRELRILVRDPASVADAESAELVQGDVRDRATLDAAVAGVDAVIHLVAIIEESGNQTFDQVIRQGTENMLAATREASLRRFLHMSALGAQPNPDYPYLQAKWAAEEAVRRSGLDWTIFRPSIIFGPGDRFINVLANLIRRAPVIPVAGSGASKFEPIAVGEVAQVYKRALDDPGTIGQTYELGGGEIYTYEQMIDLIRSRLDTGKPKLHVPISLMKGLVAVTSPLPKALRPPVTREQLKMLALDNCTDRSATAELIGHEPTALRDGLGYISR